MVCHVSLGFIYNMFGCAVLDLPFGWERGTDEDGTLIFIEWEFSLVLVNSFNKFFVSLIFTTLAAMFLTCVWPFSGY